MSKTPAAQAIETSAEFFKALGHPVRLLILNLIRAKPRHGEELALILNLNPATISHHLALLTTAGLLTSKKDQYYQVFSLDETLLQKTLAEWLSPAASHSLPEVEEDAYRKKVLDTFLQRGRLTTIPAQLKKRQVIMEKLVESFEPQRPYTEREVNQILVEFHDDVAYLRREFIELGLMHREAGIYRRK